jgi:alcohol/geraniol dehydrogenase (NADP+)
MFKAYVAAKPSAALTVQEFEEPQLGANDVAIKVQYCGICHSDLSMIDNEWGMSRFPLVAGHEVAGIIDAVGSQVAHLKAGDAVGLGWQSAYCGVCASCNHGDHNLCASAEGTIIGRHGGFAEKVFAQADSVVKIPQGLDLATVGPMFCGGITVFNPLLQFDIKPTAKVGVIGIGGLGHIALKFLNAWGCEVTAFTSSDSKAAEAKELGAHHIINSTSSTELDAAAGRFDLVISTVNVKLDWNQYINTLAPKGRLHFVGATLEPLDLNVFGLLLGQKSVSGSPVGSPESIRKMLDFALLHGIAPQVERFPMSKINEAIEHLKSGKARYRIVLENDL